MTLPKKPHGKNNIEIEKKFLIDESAWTPQNKRILKIKQGYLNSDPHRTVRVRLERDTWHKKAYLTIKGITIADTRLEYEYSIPFDQAQDLLLFCDKTLSKQRHIETHGKDTWEIDVFEDGLIIAEIELPSSKAPFLKPSFIGEEVTYDPQYFNSNLINRQPE